MLNFRKVILTVLAVFVVLVSVIAILIASFFANFYFSQFIKSHFRPGTLSRIWLLMPLTSIAGFALLRFVAKRTRLISADASTRLEERCDRILSAYLPFALAGAIGVVFVSWFPHYLFWPWWMDLEHFAMSAQMWDAGVRPYRDLVDFNFPGPIYVMWIFGKVFGWGRPMVANAIDVLAVVALCSLVIHWSRNRLGSFAPGLFSAFLIVRYYFSLDYARVMQRDWYVACLAVAAICLVQSTRSEGRWIVAGILLAIAGCLRPYSILAVGPVAIALWWERDGGRRARLAELARFVAVMAVGTIILWLPLVVHGIFDDFLRTFVEEARRGAYKSEVSETLLDMLKRQADTKIVFTGLVGIIAGLIATRKDPAMFRLVATWALACAAMLFYMPMCPVRHAYTEIPLEIFACIACGIGLWVLLESRTVAASVKTVAVVVWFASQFPGWPQFCDFRASGLAVADLVHWRNAAKPPPGCRNILVQCELNRKSRYCWEDYQETLRYVREMKDKETRVANFLWLHPYPALNGPSGRKLVFPCAEGFLWLRSVNPGLEPRYAAALESEKRAIVVKHVDSLNKHVPCPYPIIDATIRRLFVLERSFGNFEIWVPKPVVLVIGDESGL